MMTPYQRLYNLAYSRSNRSTFAKRIRELLEQVKPADYIPIKQADLKIEGYMYRIHINDKPFGNLVIRGPDAKAIAVFLNQNRDKLSIHAPLNTNDKV
jgi:hypothetical protein